MSDKIWDTLRPFMGKAIAFSSKDRIDGKYRGIVDPNGIAVGENENCAFVIYPKDGANFVSVRARRFTEGKIYYSVKVPGVAAARECECPVLDGCVPLSQLISYLRLPPNRRSIRSLIEDDGTFVHCTEIVEEFTKKGLLRKDEETLHVSLDISDQPGCMCGFASRVEELESVTRSLKRHFGVDEIVFHHTTRAADVVTTPEVEQGYKGEFRGMPGAYNDDPACGTYPIIRGLGMQWVPKEKPAQ